MDNAQGLDSYFPTAHNCRQGLLKRSSRAKVLLAMDLVIFDCDGVLVDSEALGTRVLLEIAGEFGYLMGLDQAVPLFRGVKMAECIEIIQEQTKRPVPSTFTDTFRSRCAEVFARELRMIDGIDAALDQIEIPTCVVSSSPTEKVAMMLNITGLLPRFEGRLYSAYEIGIWKPDPGLFLHVARQLGVQPSNCIVVEDSVVGVKAGVAAGMHTLGYGSPPYTDLLQREGAHIFANMRDLPGIVLDLASRQLKV